MRGTDIEMERYEAESLVRNAKKYIRRLNENNYDWTTSCWEHEVKEEWLDYLLDNEEWEELISLHDELSDLDDLHGAIVDNQITL